MAANQAEALSDPLSQPAHVVWEAGTAGVPVPKPLTLRMVRDAVGTDDEDDLLNCQVLRLAWLNITEIDHLELFSRCRDLYLQHNCLTSMDGLQHMHQLEFLALGSNRLRSVSGISKLPHLQVLDISENYIEQIPPAALPVSIRIINVYGNPFAARSDYRAALLSMLSDCQCIDHDDVTEEELSNNGKSSVLLTSATSNEGEEFARELDAELTSAVRDRFASTVAVAVKGEATMPMPAVSSDSSREKIEAVATRYLERRTGMMNTFKDQLESEKIKMQEMADALLESSGRELGEASDRLKAIRRDMISKLSERDDAVQRQVAETMEAFKKMSSS
jgi:hypothetical protein